MTPDDKLTRLAAKKAVRLDALQVQAQPNQGDPSLKRGQEAPRCGIKDTCGTDSFPVHIYSGIGNSEGPKICVSGK